MTYAEAVAALGKCVVTLDDNSTDRGLVRVAESLIRSGSQVA